MPRRGSRQIGVGAPGGPNPSVKIASRGCERSPSPSMSTTRFGMRGGKIAADGGHSHGRAQCVCAKIQTRRFRSTCRGRVATDAFRHSGPRKVVVGSACGFEGRFGVWRLWFHGQVDCIVGARAQGLRRRHVVAFSTRRGSFRTIFSCFRVIFRYGLRGVRVGEASNPGPWCTSRVRIPTSDPQFQVASIVVKRRPLTWFGG